MEFKNKTTEELIERKTAIVAEVEAVDPANEEARDMLDALEIEARGINEELAARKEAAAKKAEAREAVANGAGETIKTEIVKENNKMTIKELRASDEYINAYAEFVKSGKDTEIRGLISSNAETVPEGFQVVPVPTYLEERVMTAWEKDDILSRVRRTYVRGNLEQCFELSATDAVVHVEGTEAPAEEELVLGTIKLIPEMIKKWISITDTVARLKGREFLDYIYDELIYRITKKAAELGIKDILGAPAVTDASHIGVPVISGAPSVTIIPTAAAHLSAEAGTPVVIMNRMTDVEFLNAQVLGSFAVDPYAGLQRVYTSALKAYSAASSGDTYAIVGNLEGLQFNFPDGDDVEIIYDPYTKKNENIIEITGRYFAAHGVTRLGHFAKIAKA